MRAILGISCLLLGVALLACRVESSGERAGLPFGSQLRAERPVKRWVRTVDGWERPDSWFVAPVRPPGLHPLVVAAGQGLVSVLGLVAFGRGEE